MKRFLYCSSIIMILLSLAACGKALSSGQAQTEEEHKAYVIEDEYPEIEDDDKITVEPDKINIGFLQQSNLEEWQIIQSESFYMAFASSDEYNYNNVDAFGEIERQKELFNRMIEAPMDIIFLVPTDESLVEDFKAQADGAHVQLIIMDKDEQHAMNGEEARKMLKEATDQTDKKR